MQRYCKFSANANITEFFLQKKETASVTVSFEYWSIRLISMKRLTVGGLILVLLSSFVLLDEFVLHITRNELVALKLHGESSATTCE